MTIKEYQKKLDKRITEVNVKNRLVKDCINDVHADYVKRIFVEGKRPSGAIIGRYSKAYQKRRMKTKTFPTVNFIDKGTLNTDVANSLTVLNTFTIVNGVKNIPPKKGDDNSKKKGKTNSEKIDLLIKQYGEDVWKLGKEQRKQLNKCVSRTLLKIMIS